MLSKNKRSGNINKLNAKMTNLKKGDEGRLYTINIQKILRDFFGVHKNLLHNKDLKRMMKDEKKNALLPGFCFTFCDFGRLR